MLKQEKNLFKFPFHLIFILLFTTFFSIVSSSNFPSAVQAATVYTHPGMLHTQSDLDRMKTKVAAGSSPWIDEWELLQDNAFASSSFTPTYRSIVYRADPTNGNLGNDDLQNSGTAAYFNALEWYITGNQAYANEAISLLNGWSNTLTSIQGGDAIIAAGLYGNKLLNAAEIIRYTNAGWQQADIDKFSTMMTNVFYPITQNYGGSGRNGAVDALLILFNICYGVWNNDDTAYNAAVNYFKTGSGNGSIDHFIQTDDGQTQEAGRDQAHNQLAVGMLVDAAEVGFNQASVNSNGADMVSYPNNTYKLLKGVEYTAKYNLGYPVPFVSVQSADGKAPYSQVSSQTRGQFRPMYEQIYNLYHNKVGLADTSMPFTKQVINTVKLEGYNPDHASFGGLLNAQDTRTAPLIPNVAISPVSLSSYVVTAASGGTNPLIANVNRFAADGSFNIGTQETFAMEYQGNKTYAFKSLINNKYVSTNSGGSAYLIADATSIGTAQQFTVTVQTNGPHNIQSKANNLYENVDSTSQIAATVSGITSDSQRFDFLPQKAAVTSTDTPTTPANLTASIINNRQIALKWTASTDNEGVIGYKIYRNGTQIGTAYTNSYTDTGLFPETAYSYTVQAYDAAGTVSAQSNTASNTTAGMNLAVYKTVTSSSNNCCAWDRPYVVDGIESAVSSPYGWMSNNTITVNHTEWVQVDMGASNTISQVTLFPRDDGQNAGVGFPVDFNIAVSTDGTNWTTVVTKTNQPFVTSAQAFTFAPVFARYVKITGTNLRPNPYDNNYYRMTLAEIEIFQQVTSGRTYKLVARHSGKLAGVNGGSLSDGATVVQQTDTGSNSQKWIITDLGTGYYKISNVNSGKAMNVSGGSTADGAQIIQWTYGGNNNEQWQFIDVGNGYFKIVARHSGKGLNVANNSMADGAQIVQWNYGGGNNEQWSLIADPTDEIQIAPSMVTASTNQWPGTGTQGSNGWLAFDGVLSTSTDTTSNPSWILVDFGLNNQQSLGSVKYYPRSGNASRMNGAILQGSNDGTNFVNLYTINGVSTYQWYTAAITDNAPYRYFRYYTTTGFANVAELELHR